jgi:hypothetical protein
MGFAFNTSSLIVFFEKDKQQRQYKSDYQKQVKVHRKRSKAAKRKQAERAKQDAKAKSWNLLSKWNGCRRGS